MSYETTPESENFIDESLVIDKSYYEKIKEEITCIICHGLLNNPVMCDNCETHFCLLCIDYWKRTLRGCPKKCPKPLVVKKMVRSFKNLVDKVLLRCPACKESISLMNYPEHIKPCTEINSYIDCPFCKSCRLNKQEMLLEDNTENDLIGTIIMYKNKIEKSYEEYKTSSDKYKTKLMEKIKKLEQELKDTKFTFTEEFKLLKAENEKYIKDAHDKTMENINLMKEVEIVNSESKLRNQEKKKSIEKKNSVTEKGILKEFLSIAQSEVITAVITVPYKDELVFVSGGRDKLIRVWSLNYQQQPLMILKGHTHYINCLAKFLYDGEWVIASAGLDKTIKIWRLSNHDKPFVNINKCHTDQINALVSIVCRDQVFIVSGSQDFTVKVWRIENNDLPTFILKGHSDSVFALEKVTINNEHMIVSGGKDQTIRVWDVANATESTVQPSLILRGHSDTIFALKTIMFKGNQLIASGSRDQTIKIWLINLIKTNDTPIFTLRGHFDYVRVLTTIVNNQSEQLLVSGSWDKTIKIWSLDTPENALQTLKGNNDYVIALESFTYKGENMLLSGGQDMTIKLFK